MCGAVTKVFLRVLIKLECNRRIMSVKGKREEAKGGVTAERHTDSSFIP